jgi:hypothetical protein
MALSLVDCRLRIKSTQLKYHSTREPSTPIRMDADGVKWCNAHGLRAIDVRAARARR